MIKLLSRRGKDEPSQLREPTPTPLAAEQDAVATLGAEVENVEAEETAAFETVAAMVRAMGAHPIDIEGSDTAEFRRECEAWARHVLVRAPAPLGEQAGPVKDPTKRAWVQLRRFFLERRRREQGSVASSIGELRGVVWAFVESIGAALARERQDVGTLRHQIERLRSAASQGSLEEVRREVREAIDVLTELAETRSSRQTEMERQVAELNQKVSSLASELQDAKRESATDAMTGLLNRSGFAEAVNRAIAVHSVFNQPSCLLLIDLDDFKWVNDTFGHLIGDEVIRGVAETMVKVFPRRSDALCRFGGDEFAIIVTDTDLADGARLAERLMQSVRDLAIAAKGDVVKVTTSIGVAGLEPGITPEQWVEKADRALYRAKEKGRDRAVTAGLDAESKAA